MTSAPTGPQTIGGTTVPGPYVGYVYSAAQATGMPASVVAAQINLESGFDPTAVSPTGAQGIAQFEPGTWAQYGSGSPDNPQDAFTAYAKYMGVLLKDEKSSIQDALAAYNAGPGNIQAGLGYADTILTRAGVPDSAKAGAGLNPGGIIGDIGSATGLTAVASGITGLAQDFEGFAKVLGWLTLPSSWTRIFSGMLGAAFLGAGVYLLGKEAKNG
jgi:Transglycosylase SLT domain